MGWRGCAASRPYGDEQQDQEPATTIVWAIRRPALAGEDPRAAAGARACSAARADAQRLVAGGAVELVTAVEVAAVRVSAPGLTVVNTRGPLGPFDEIVAATGFRPNLAMLRELRVELDPALESPRALAPLIDPHIHCWPGRGRRTRRRARARCGRICDQGRTCCRAERRGRGRRATRVTMAA